eukprot:GHVS01038395.1.p1 GENE.GHVS01038395.1~~GHVS01038395.1.p1  ORF type:complete len:163 (+),score=13.92 GHVS01038395.1:1-489(+)
MAIPLLRIGLPVLLFAFFKVAESQKWDIVTFREVLLTVEECNDGDGIILHPFANLPRPAKGIFKKAVDRDSVTLFASKVHGPYMRPVRKLEEFGFVFEEYTANETKRTHEILDEEVFKEKSCKKNGSWKLVIFTDSKKKEVQLVVGDDGSLIGFDPPVDVGN